MAEFRIYSGNGAYPSSYSNLSPLVPPFTVDRSNSRPPGSQVFGPPEPSYSSPLNSTSSNWVDSSRKDGYLPLDSVLPSNVYPFHGNDHFSGATANMPSLDAIATASIPPFSYGANMAATQAHFSQSAVYYPPNLSPLVCNPSPHDAALKEPFLDQESSLCQKTQFDGFWEGSTWDPFQKGGFSKEMNMTAPSVLDDRASSGGRRLKFKGLPDEASLGIHMLAKEAQVDAAGIGNEHPDYFLREHPSDISFVKQAVHGPFSVHPGTSLHASPAKAIKSKGNQVTCISPYQKDVTQKHAVTVSNTLSAMSSSPVCLSKPPVAGASCSTSDAVSFGAVDHVFSAIDMGSSVTNRSNVKEHSQIPSHGRKDFFDPSLVSMQLQNHDYVSSEFPAIGIGEPSNSGISSNDAFDHFFVGNSGTQALPFDRGVLGQLLDDCEASMRVEKPLDILDHYTLSVDSPCWKGSLGSHFSPFGTAKVVVRHTEVPRACGSNIQGPQAEVGFNAVKISPEGPCNGLGYCENESLGDCTMVSLNRPVISDLQLGESLSHDVKETMSWQMKNTRSNDRLKDVIEPTEGCALPEKSVNEPNKSVNKSYLKLHQTVRQTLQGTVPASESLHRFQTSGADALGTNMSSLSTGECNHLLYSLGAPIKHSQSYDKTPAPKNHVQTLVGTMYNLSELVLFFCSKEDHKLEEQDFEALKNVTENLGKCMSKFFGVASLLPEPQKGASVDSQQSAASSVLRQPQLSEPHEEVNNSSSHNKESSSFPCIKADAGMDIKDEKIIQVIKLALRDKFHDKEEHPQITLYKNLWLEAEAASCAGNCTARYNHMKFEMGKSKSETSRDLLEETVGEKEVSTAESDGGLQPLAEDGPSSACFSAVTRNNYGDVMARLDILKSRGDNTNSNEATDVDVVPSFKSSQFNYVETSSPTEEKDIPTHDLLIQASPILSATSQADDIDAFVMDRFRILKNRSEGSSSELNEGKPPSLVSNLEFVCERREDSHGKDVIENDAEKVPALQSSAANNAGNKLELRNLNVNFDPVIQRPSGSKLANNLTPSWYDNSSSDWEHVLTEEL